MEITISRSSWAQIFPKFSIKTQPTDTIKDVKLKIQDQEGFSFDLLHLYKVNQVTFEKTPLEDDKTLQHYLIEDKEQLYLVVGTRIFCKNPLGYTRPIVVSQNIKIKEVKEMIEEYEFFPVSEQVIIRDTIELEDEKTLQDYSIKYDDIIYIYSKNPRSFSDE